MTHTSSLQGFMLAAGLAIAIPLGLERLIGPHLVINHTASLPPGLYWRSSVPASGPQHGDIVISCIPASYARYAHSIGVLDIGECNGIGIHNEYCCRRTRRWYYAQTEGVHKNSMPNQA